MIIDFTFLKSYESLEFDLGIRKDEFLAMLDFIYL
jgi:hypothetical protein